MQRIPALLERAKHATGHDYFGEETFREGLGRLVSSVDAEARLNEQGRAIADRQIIDLLGWRLRVEHWYAIHPEIDDQEIIAPLIGLGLPRTGSTALSCMLAEDPSVRCIRTWEGSAPCPPPETATESNDPRIAEEKVRQAYQDQMWPRLKTMLPVSATAPVECHNFMAYDFKSMIFQAMMRIPSYVRWLNYEADLVPTYSYVKRVLKLLQWRCPPYRWRLKNPSNIVFIGALDQVFPDARFWMTHRDIVQVLPSNIDLHYELSHVYSDSIDIEYLTNNNIDWTELGMRRVLDFRKRGNDTRFFDVDFAEFQRDPMPIIERLYAFLGEPLTQLTRQRMLAWRQAETVGKHGRHDYAAGTLPLDLDEIRSRFSFYNHNCGVTASVT